MPWLLPRRYLIEVWATFTDKAQATLFLGCCAVSDSHRISKSDKATLSCGRKVRLLKRKLLRSSSKVCAMCDVDGSNWNLIVQKIFRWEMLYE
ncbi:hypothetical protein ACLKA6_002854 [Drosophila palustris]